VFVTEFVISAIEVVAADSRSTAPLMTRLRAAIEQLEHEFRARPSYVRSRPGATSAH
jgi:hypothetical protein